MVAVAEADGARQPDVVEVVGEGSVICAVGEDDHVPRVGEQGHEPRDLEAVVVRFLFSFREERAAVAGQGEPFRALPALEMRIRDDAETSVGGRDPVM